MSGRYDWNKYGRPRVALFNRIMGWVLPCVTVALWVLCILLVRDWTVSVAPLMMTAAVVAQRLGMRRVYGVDRPRPDYSAIAAMEREVYGEEFKHEGAPSQRGRSNPNLGQCDYCDRPVYLGGQCLQCVRKRNLVAARRITSEYRDHVESLKWMAVTQSPETTPEVGH